MEFLIKKKKKNMLTELNKQINEELYSSYLYVSMAANFKDMNLEGMAAWMEKQAKEEVEHAMKFYNYIYSVGGSVELHRIDKPSGSWKTALSAFEAAYKHEKHVTGRIHFLLDLANKEKDYPTASMLKWFVDEQVEEEASADEIVQKLKLAHDAPGAVLMIDRELGSRK